MIPWKALPRNWQLIIAAVLLTACAVIAVSDAWLDIVWVVCRDEEANHVLLVPFVVGWLVWVRRHRLASMRARGHVCGVGIVAMGWLLYLYGYHRWIQVLWHGGAIVIVIGSLITVAGADLIRAFFPALAAMLFLMPLPGVTRQLISLPLERVAAIATQYLLNILGTDVDRSGNILRIHHVAVAIGEACNGLRMISALSVVLFAVAFGAPMSTLARGLVLAATPVVAVIFNVIRLVPTVWMYGNFSVATADWFHAISGWIMLVLAFVSLIAALQVLRWASVAITPARPASD